MKNYTLNREDTVFLIIDIQEKLVPVMKHRDKVIKNILILLEVSRNMNIPVLITEQYPKGLGGTIPEIMENIDNSTKIFEKIDFSGYTDEVKFELEKINNKKIVITGMETHVCVFQTVRDLIDQGYEVFVSKDGVASRTKDNFKNSIEIMKSMGAIITNTETIVFDLLKKAGTPEFKKISKLIK